jgi:hypothetical protein
MNVMDGGRDAPLSPRGRIWFICLCTVLGVLALVVLIVAR